MIETTFDKAFDEVSKLVDKFENNKQTYMSANYSEAEARQDFIDKFFTALGWDVSHLYQHEPHRQEVKIEKSHKQHNEATRKRADYAFYLAPNFKDVHFFVEAKKPSVLIQNNPQHYFQTIKYGWNAGCPISILTDFEEFVIVDCRSQPNINYALNGKHKSYRYTDYKNKDKFAEIFNLFSHEAIANKSIKNYVDSLPKAKRTKSKFGGATSNAGEMPIDESFLEYIDNIRNVIAKAFKKANPDLDSAALTEATQRTVDRLVFTRFLEDKLIEPVNHINDWAKSNNAWKAFITDCAAINVKYNGVVFKEMFIDKPNFLGADTKLFSDICAELSSYTSPYDFNLFPIHILGSIYERFLGKVVVATAKQVHIEEKPEVRKAGGVYYTPKYIVDYIVEHTIGKLIHGKTPAEISQMHFADIACGSGSFLIGVYDYLIQYHKEFYYKYANRAQKDGCINMDGTWVLSIHQKQNILLNNVFGVDIDNQAVEVTQLSLFLKMLEDETLTSTMAQGKQTSLYAKVLPDLSKNIVCGNSLVDMDISNTTLFDVYDERKINALNFEATFPKVFKNKTVKYLKFAPDSSWDDNLEPIVEEPMQEYETTISSGGFDAIVGNPPYLSTKGISEIEKKYFVKNYLTATGQFDLYGLFVERGFSVLNKIGKLGFITSNTFLSNKDFLSLRKLLLKKTNLQVIANFGETVFKDANLDVCVFIFEKEKKENEIKIFKNDKDFFANKFHSINQNIFDNELENFEILINLNNKDLKCLAKLFSHQTNLSNFFLLPRGIELGSNSDKISKVPKTDFSKLLVGKNIKKYETNFNNLYIKFEKNDKSVFKEFSIYNQEKILIQRIRNLSLATRIVATLDTENHLCTNTLRIGIPKENNYNLKYFLGILNSSVVNYIFTKKFLNKDIYAYQLDRIPIPNLNLTISKHKKQHDTLVTLVEQMLVAKQQLQTAVLKKDISFCEKKCNTLTSKIDAAVYELYDLTADEINIVEGINI